MNAWYALRASSISPRLRPGGPPDGLDMPGQNEPLRRLMRGGPGWTYRAPAGRTLSGLVGVAALVAGGRLGREHSRVLWTTAVLPDIALLYGIGAAPTFERLPSHAVRPYNVLHSPAVPAALLTLAALTRSRRTAVAGLGWLGHIGVDRALVMIPDGAEVNETLELLDRYTNFLAR